MNYGYVARGRIRTLRRLGAATTRPYYWNSTTKKWTPK